MFWILMGALIISVMIMRSWEYDDVGGLLAIIVILISFMHAAVIWTHCDISRADDYAYALARYEDGQYNTYEKLKEFEIIIDEHNHMVELAQNKFLSWPYASEKWRNYEIVEYPVDFQDKIAEAIKNEITK